MPSTVANKPGADAKLDGLRHQLFFGMSVDFNLSSSLNQLLTDKNGARIQDVLFDLPFGGEVCATPSANWSASGEDVTQARNFYTESRIFLDVYVVIALCLIGFIGNALAIAVLRRDQLNTTSWLLQTLAVVDIAYLVACLFIQSLRTINESTDWAPTLHSVVPRIEPYLWPAASTAQTVTVWIVLLLTVDRYVAVCSPFDPGLRTLRRARISVIVVLLAATAYNAPLLAEREAFEDIDFCTGEKRWRTRKAEAFSDLYVVGYKTVSYFVFRAVGPLVALLVLNTRLIVALDRSRQRRKQLAMGGRGVGVSAARPTTSTTVAAGSTTVADVSSAAARPRPSGKHRENITLMLVVVVSVFIVCQLPDLGLRIAGNQTELDHLMEKNREKYRLINSVTNVMLTLNSSINFLIYCLVGKKFRRIFVRMVCSGSSTSQATTTADVESRRQMERKLPAVRCCGGGSMATDVRSTKPAAAASPSQYIALAPPRTQLINVTSVTSLRGMTEQSIGEYDDEISVKNQPAMTTTQF